MSKYGLQVYGIDGKTIVFDSSTLTTKVLGSGRTNAVDNYITDDNIVGQRVWVKTSVIYTAGSKMPQYTIDGNKISWKHYMPLSGGAITWDESSLTNADCGFIYGVY